MDLFVAAVIIYNLLNRSYSNGKFISEAVLTKNTPTSQTFVCNCSDAASCTADNWKDLLAECRQKAEKLIHQTTSEQAQDTTTPSEETTTPGVVYRGCYRDMTSRVLPYAQLINESAMTTDMCRMHCVKKEYTFFGIEVGWECWCGYMIKSGYSKLSDNECSMPCPGAPKEACGGHWKIAIYHVL